MSQAPPPSREPASEQGESPLPVGDAQHVQVTLTPAHLIRVVTVNLLVLAELCVAMYFANEYPEEFTAVFMKVFFSLLVPTLILAALSKRLMRPKAKP